MSSSSSTDPLTYASAVALPTTTTFLPVLDDLLSPDFRPVALPPITPLQTPTTTTSNQPQSCLTNNGNASKVVDKSEAAVKIQKWWKNNKSGKVEVGGEEEHEEEADLKHRIRHRRTEEYIRHLESEVTRLKHSLTAERKLRSLQYEAIRSLWSQVQKITANNVSTSGASLMTQSLPNGLPLEELKPPSPPQQPQSCTCTTEITNLKLKVEQEMSDLRKLVSQLVVQKEQSEGANGNGGGEQSKVNKRPDTLDLGGNGTGKHGELQGYADSVARSVVQQAGVCGGTEGSNNDSKDA